jgi:hypothetical protein
MLFARHFILAMYVFIILAHVLVVTDPPEVHDFRMDGSGYVNEDACNKAAKAKAESIARLIDASPQLNGQVSYGCARSPTHEV